MLRIAINLTGALQFLLGLLGTLLLTAAPVAAQDMPLSQVLLEGAGWRKVAKDSKLIPRWTADAIDVPGLAIRDSIMTRTGARYCTVPAKRAVYLISPEGQKRLVERGIGSPAGLTLWPDQGTLVVGDAASKYLWAFRIEPDGSLSHKDRYYTLRSRAGQKTVGTAALTTDTAGRVYAATAEGVQVFDPTGRLSGVLLNPSEGPIAAVAFGGPDRSVLCVLSGDEVYARKTQAKGVPLQKKPTP